VIGKWISEASWLKHWRLMMRRIKTGAAFVCAGAFTLVLLSAPAGAATPAVQGCVGSTVSPLAQNQPAPGAFGRGVEFFARDPFSRPGLGDAIQALQAGVVPDLLVPNTCND
jgi:hypothetical protein